ncbi:MAG: hypothetical protein NTW73_02800 [Candidatus Parcubacteria bacterium]|nr:hypothetical protein [Candidatus Parcubacteria bacterium]
MQLKNNNSIPLSDKNEMDSMTVWMPPRYNLDKIKFGTDPSTYEKAIALCEDKKITQFKKEFKSFSAIVLGTKPYKVYVSEKHYDRGNCECYLGQNEVLCKHMVAVAIYAVLGGEELSQDDKKIIAEPMCTKILGELTEGELTLIKQTIASALRYIKAYYGPSRNWLAYQDSLQEGCLRLSQITSDLPVSLQTTKLLVDMLLRLDVKLQRGGVDDSDGTICEFVENIVRVLQEYAEFDSSCLIAFKKLKNKQTCFGWEEPLVKLISKPSESP